MACTSNCIASESSQLESAMLNLSIMSNHLKTKQKLFQQRAGLGNLIHFHTFPSKSKNQGIDTQSYTRILETMIRLFNCDLLFFKTLDSADNRCKFLPLLFQFTKHN